MVTRRRDDLFKLHVVPDGKSSPLTIGEADSQEAFDILHNRLIDETTDWDGIGYAYDAENSTGEEVDKEKFYSPWRLGNKVGRAEIIRHCRQLVKNGVKWGDAA